METMDIITLIKVGFERPKWYKRSVWNKAVKVMEHLADTTNGEIVRTNLGGGLEKYTSKVEVTLEQLAIWATSYKRSLGETLHLTDTMPELRRIARELGVKVNNYVVLQEYYRRHPEEA